MLYAKSDIGYERRILDSDVAHHFPRVKVVWTTLVLGL